MERHIESAVEHGEGAMRMHTMPGVACRCQRMTRTLKGPYDYGIIPRMAQHGGGSRLRLLQDDEEVGGSVFAVAQDEAAGIVWWNKLICYARAIVFSIAVIDLYQFFDIAKYSFVFCSGSEFDL
jgi:hypothetical protein